MIQFFFTRAELEQLLKELDAKVDQPRIVRAPMSENIPNEVQTIYITRRNIKTLLSKLNRAEAGEPTACTVIKRDTEHATYPCSCEAMLTALTAVDRVPLGIDGAIIYALEDDEYYVDREPGPVHHRDIGALL